MLEIHDDIQTAMSQPISDDDADLEEELAQLLEDEKPREMDQQEKDAAVKQLEDLKKLNLPSTPKKRSMLSENSINV